MARGLLVRGFSVGVGLYSPEKESTEMTLDQILELAERLASLGVVPILLVFIWQLWLAYQRVVDDLRKAREQLDVMRKKSGDTKPITFVRD
jgi:hypothetical protein